MNTSRTGRIARNPLAVLVRAVVALTLAAVALVGPHATAAHASAADCGVPLPGGGSWQAQSAIGYACHDVATGVPFVSGGGHGTSPGPTNGGLDGAGFVRWAYSRAAGYDMGTGSAADLWNGVPAMARATAAQGTAPLTPGDLMFFSPTGATGIHQVALYLGAGYFAEELDGTTAAQVSQLAGRDYFGAIRVYNLHNQPSFSGRGRSDLVLQDGDSFHMWWNDAGQNGGWPWGHDFRDGGGWTSVPHDSVYFADLTGSGRKDLIKKEGDGFHIWYDINGGTSGAYPWDGGSLCDGCTGWAGVSADDIWFADINGDGKADLIRRNGDYLTYWPNLGDGKHYGAAVTIGYGFGSVDPRSIYFADLTGSGRADLILKQYDGFHIWHNVNGQQGGWPWDNGANCGACVGWAGVGASEVWFADITGDGKADLIRRSGDNLIYWPNTSDGTAYGPQAVTIGYGFGSIDPEAVHFA